MTILNSPASKSRSPAFGSSNRPTDAIMPAIARGHDWLRRDCLAVQLTSRALQAWAWAQAWQALHCPWAVPYCHEAPPQDERPAHWVPEERHQQSDEIHL